MPGFFARLRRSKILPPVLGLAVLAAIVFGLHRALEKVSLGEVLAAIGATPRAQLVHAGLLTAGSLCIMCVYDVPGILFAWRLAGFPRLGVRRVALASGCAYALSHVLGVPALTAAAVRVRLYAQWAVPASGLARIVTLSGVMFTLGAAALLGGILVLHPADVPLFGDMPSAALRGLGLVFWLVPAGYVAAAGGERKLVVARRAIPRPGPVLAAAQIALSCADTGCAAAILYVVLPTVPGLSFPHVLGIYLAAFAGGLVSALPGGVGVFDSVLLLGLAGFMDAAQALGAILLFRLLYYILPAALAGVAFFGHEIWLGVRRTRVGEKLDAGAENNK
jgi:uncharacterized membrane protein YbhN (UPF0104 family)